MYKKGFLIIDEHQVKRKRYEGKIKKNIEKNKLEALEAILNQYSNFDMDILSKSSNHIPTF